ncbi:NACHT C-terminal helical domain 2-containing protein [Nostoc sp.]
MKHLNTNPIRRKFETQHKKIFKQYYEANELLVNCLKISCLEPDYISKYFYNNLFLPISRIEKPNCQN